MMNELSFPGKISKMGNNKIIWIPKPMHDMVEPFEGKTVTIKIMRRNRRGTFGGGEMLDTDD
jgi:hypothetical protein